MSKVITPARFPKPRGYSNGVIAPAGRTLYVSGQIAWDKDARIVSPGETPGQYAPRMVGFRVNYVMR